MSQIRSRATSLSASARRVRATQIRCAGMLLSIVAVFQLLICAAPAQDILYHVDHSVGTDRMAVALSLLPASFNVTVAVDRNDFATRIASGNYDLGILFQQGDSGSDYDAAFAALGTFIAGGGRAIANDWTRNNSHAAPFGAGFAAGTNETSFTVTHAPLATGIANPVQLLNPGWGVFATGLDETSGFSAGTFGSGQSSIVVGNDGRTIFNGFLADTFFSPAQGAQLFTNEIYYVMGVPEPATALLGTIAIVGMANLVNRRRRNPLRTGSLAGHVRSAS